MRRRLACLPAALLFVAAVAAAVADAAVAAAVADGHRRPMKVHPIVSPASGGPQTTFVIRFTSHVRLGRHNGFALEYDLEPFYRGRPTTGCEGTFEQGTRRGRRGQLLVLRANAHSSPVFDTGWCPGLYTAKVRLVRFSCRPSGPRPCVTKTVVGHVSWRVTRS